MAFPYWILSFLIIPTAIIIGGVYIIESSYEQKVDQKISEIKDKLVFQKQQIESNFQNTIKAQEGFGNLDEWKSLIHTDSYNSEIGGIPQDFEKEKRKAAKYMIEEFGFQSFGITSLDGKMYFLEPFEDQLSLSKYNFADREWFQGVLNSQETYVSDIFISSATNHPIIVISTPLFSQEGNIIGMWGGGIDLEFLTSYLHNLQDKSTSVILIDNNDIVIADTRDFDYHGKAPQSLLISESTQSGYSFDKELDSHVFHTSIKIKNKEWPLYATIAEDNFLLVGKQKKLEAYTLLISMQVFIVIITIFVWKNVRKNYKLTQALQENQDKLIKQEKLSAIGKLSARFAHDIRNPLSNIRMAVDMVQKNKQITSDSTINDKFEIISTNLDRISHQVNDVLDFVRTPKLEKKEIQLLSCLKESLSTIKIPKNIKIIIPNNDTKIIADSNHLQIVFKNLILNSLQAIGNEEGNITIRFDEKNEHIKIEIEDSGKGFPEEETSNIFEPLTTTKQNGIGLGLASCKTIIENHGGTITARNDPTRFTIRLPKK
ncbi:MAG: ATP-binding protein [Candidatus Nitrosomaritimum yanchengensis]